MRRIAHGTAVYGLIILLLSVIGCIGSHPPSQPVKYYQLDYPSPKISLDKTPLPYVIRVDPFQPSDLYRSQRIVYQDGRYLASRYPYHQWITAPDRMVPKFLVRDLRHADIVNAVFFNSGEAATHRLVGNLEAFYENDQPNPWKAVAAVSMALMETGGDMDIAEQICFQKTYKVNKTCTENTPAGFVAAMSRAMAEISRLIINDIYNELSVAEGGD
ncbi:MAG: membrane integrity-associated transporter subunit PqiC [Desulfobacterales bacterium]|nr:membrane integrity-associated transporter subunit PqiC [Desulfobacterales bacterium]